MTYTPLTEGYSKTIEYSRDGFFRWYINGKLQDERKFFLKEGTSIYTVETAYLIEYDEDFVKQSISFGEKETLFF